MKHNIVNIEQIDSGYVVSGYIDEENFKEVFYADDVVVMNQFVCKKLGIFDDIYDKEKEETDKDILTPDSV